MNLSQLKRYHNPEFASFFPRFLAFEIDYAIYGSWLSLGLWFLSSSTKDNFFSNCILAVTLIVLPGIFLSMLYRVYMLSRFGQTFGKMVVGIEVLDKDKKRISWKRAAFRELVAQTVSAYVLGTGYLWILFDPKHRAWHDHFTGTYVYKKQHKDLLPAMIIVIMLFVAHGAIAYFCFQQLSLLLPTLITSTNISVINK